MLKQNNFDRSKSFFFFKYELGRIRYLVARQSDYILNCGTIYVYGNKSSEIFSDELFILRDRL